MSNSTMSAGQSPLLNRLARAAVLIRDALVAMALGWIGVSVVADEERTPHKQASQPAPRSCDTATDGPPNGTVQPVAASCQ